MYVNKRKENRMNVNLLILTRTITRLSERSPTAGMQPVVKIVQER